jgi:hypothetical protein
LVATIRSGLSDAIASTGTPSARLRTTGWVPPSFGCAQGHTPNGSPPNQSVTAIGTMPTASRSSCPVRPALTTRLGGAGIFVSPNTCLTVTEPSSATSPGFDSQAATNAAVPAVNARKPRRDNEPGTRRE